MKSRAAVMVAERTLEVRELLVPPDPPLGGAIVRVVANGLCGTDYELYAGRLDRRFVNFPMVPGHEIIGRIETIHPEAASNWGVGEGDRVAVEPIVPCGVCRSCANGQSRSCPRPFRYSATPITFESGLWGGMSEYMVLRPGTRIHKVPDDLGDSVAGMFNMFANALEWTVRVGRVGVGDRVLVLGAGQRGLACCVAAKEAGAADIIVTGLRQDAHKLALAGQFGATAVVNVEKDDLVPRVRGLLDGGDVDVVIDTVPHATDPILQALELLRFEGTLVLAGLKGRPAPGFPTDLVVLKALRLLGGNATTPWTNSQALRILAEHAYPFERLHSHTFGLDDLDRAFQILGGEVRNEDVVHISIRP